MLEGLENASATSTASVVGVGLDSCVTRTRIEGVHLVQTTDFFYPSVDDPYIQGKIGAANVLSDLYAMGVVDCDNVLMLLAVSLDMTPLQRQVTTKLLIQGFNDLCLQAGTSVNGGQTVRNPWMIIGGVASSVCRPQDYIMPDGAIAGDILVLTKPLGTQVAVNAHQWLGTTKFGRIAGVCTPESAKSMYHMAMYSMSQLNREGARLMQKYKAHGATDVTGFGIQGHASNLAKHQKAEVDFEIHTLPVLRGTPAVNSIADYGLLKGTSAETSGGLLIALNPDIVDAFCEELSQSTHMTCWKIGKVVPGTHQAKISDQVVVLEVDIPKA